MRVLVLNAGSSSVKYQVIDGEEGTTVLGGLLENIGTGGPRDHEEALRQVVADLGDVSGIDAVGHRVVHGGSQLVMPTVITDEVEDQIESLSSLAPLHNPANLQGIRAARRALPSVSHCAVFDTAFHHTVSQAAATVAIPQAVARVWGIKKYGFHGTSHSYVSRVASDMVGGDRNQHRIITAHLGNGSSMAAILGGVCVDTSMGFTPLPGLVMGTRPGDIDPAIVTYLSGTAKMSVNEVDTMLNKHSGLMGIAGTSDFREITTRANEGDQDAHLAVDVWAWRIKHYLGAYTALLGGLDALVFTGGIGENSAMGREKATEGLGFMGIALDRQLNQLSTNTARFISPPEASVAVLVIPTNEELEIARQVADLVGQAR